MNEKSRALVTGGAGFLGGHVGRDLLDLGYEVVALDDLSGGCTENVDPRADFVEASILDVPQVEALFEKYRFDYVFHLAAYAAEGLSHFIKRFNYTNNLIGSVNLINAAINYEIKCFVFTSSIAVYGENQLPMTEETVPLPEDPYGIAKLAVESELAVSRRMFGLDFVVFRPHNVYGEYQNLGDPYRNVVGIFMNQIMQGNSLTVFGDGEQSRAFTYVRDISPVIAQAARDASAYGEVFNIGADEVYTVNQLVREVGNAMGVEPQINYLPSRSEVKHAYSDHGKVKTAFGYETRYSLEAGLANMAEWANASGIRKSQKFDQIEIEKGLPPSWQALMK